MAKKLNSAKILEDIEASKSDRTKTSLYISKAVYEAFKESLAKSKPIQSPSVVIEKLMKEFVLGMKK